MDVSDVYVELFDRIPPLVHAAVDGLDPETLVRTPTETANSVAWLVWHLTRVQDHHMTEILDGEQVWLRWHERFGLPADPNNTGFGHGPAEVAAVRPESAKVLVGYAEAVAERTREFLKTLTPADLDRIVDRRWTPPVTLGVRLVSIADDSLQHVGQAAYARGLVAPGWRLGY